MLVAEPFRVAADRSVAFDLSAHERVPNGDLDGYVQRVFPANGTLPHRPPDPMAVLQIDEVAELSVASLGRATPREDLIRRRAVVNRLPIEGDAPEGPDGTRLCCPRRRI